MFWKTAADGVNQEYFLAVKISSSEILATVWSLNSGLVNINDVGSQKIANASFEALLEAVDAAVSQAVGNRELPAVKTIFGLFPDWINEGKIIEPKLEILKHLCKELDLRPLGYVLLSEAIENYLKEKEGAPLTAVLAGIDGDSGWVTLVRAGKNLGTVPLSSGEVGDDAIPTRIEQALKQFEVDVLPARVIIYDSRKDLKALEAKIMAYPWTKQLPFLHFPKVEILTGESVVKAVASASGTQMGARIETIEESKPEPELQEISAQEAGFIQEGNLGRLGRVPEVKLTALKNLIQKFRMPTVAMPKVVPLIAIALVVLVGIVVASIYFMSGAQIYIHLESKPFERDMEMTVSGQFVETTGIGTKKGVATGHKLVGEKAHGSVTIYSTAASKTFASGTVLTSADGKKFALNSETSVASGSGAASQVTTTANVTAFDIGENYNLPAGTLFTIANNPSSSYQAKNEGAFSGGNSHEATVVTKADQDRLFAALSAELAERAGSDLDAKLTTGQKLLPNAVTSIVSKKKFSKDIDAEAETFSLDLTMDFKGITASQDDLVSRFMEKYGSDVPEGYKLDPSSVNLEIKSAKLDKSGNAVLNVSLTAKSLPQVDVQEMLKQVVGKDRQTAVSILTSNVGVSNIEIMAKPKFFQPVTERFIPWRVENIQVESISD